MQFAIVVVCWSASRRLERLLVKVKGVLLKTLFDLGQKLIYPRNIATDSEANLVENSLEGMRY
jgi:hypothetical protein